MGRQGKRTKRGQAIFYAFSLHIISFANTAGRTVSGITLSVMERGCRFVRTAALARQTRSIKDYILFFSNCKGSFFPDVPAILNMEIRKNVI